MTKCRLVAQNIGLDVKNDGVDVILRAKMTVAMSFCVVISDEYDIIAACF